MVDGVGAATDIGSLQGHSDGNTVFQVASQFNCLESGGPWIRPVAGYVNDPTQGPRASISAFPGALLRHYRAPIGEGAYSVQTSDGPQVNLLADVCDDGLAKVNNGYLLAADVVSPSSFTAALETRFEAIKVGVHNGIDVVLGYDWDGAVSKPTRIAQVFTSTVAGGAYGRIGESLLGVCRQLLRAAYLGTLLASASLRHGRVVLTPIGGGVFGNPPHLIWESILWALAEVEPLLSGDLDVIVNARTLGQAIDRQTIVDVVRDRGGAMVEWALDGRVVIHR